MKNNFIFFSITLITMLLTGCGAAEKGENVSSEFFTAVINEEYENASTMFESDIVSDHDELIELLKVFGNNPVNGKLQSAEKSFGFNSNVTNGVTTVVLPYELTYEKETLTCEITLIDRGNGLKISALKF